MSEGFVSRLKAMKDREHLLIKDQTPNLFLFASQGHFHEGKKFEGVCTCVPLVSCLFHIDFKNDSTDGRTSYGFLFYDTKGIEAAPIIEVCPAKPCGEHPCLHTAKLVFNKSFLENCEPVGRLIPYNEPDATETTENDIRKVYDVLATFDELENFLKRFDNCELDKKLSFLNDLNELNAVQKNNIKNYVWIRDFLTYAYTELQINDSVYLRLNLFFVGKLLNCRLHEND